MGSRLDSADARLAGAIVRGAAYRRQEELDALVVQPVGQGDEARAVVALEDEWNAVTGEERGETSAHGIGVGVVHGQCAELIAAAEVAHHEEVAVLAVDGAGRLGEVHRPDVAWYEPAHDMHEGVAVQVLAAIVTEKAGDLASRYPWQCCTDLT